MSSSASSTPSTSSMLRPVSKWPNAARCRLFAGAPYVNTEALSRDSKKPSSQTPLKVLKGHTNALWGLAFFPGGRRLVSGSWDQKLIIWDLTSGEVERELTGHTDWITSVAVAPAGSVVASASEDGTLRLWDGTTGKEIGEPITVHSLGYRGVWGVSFSPDGRRVAATCEGTVWIWDVRTQALITGPLKTSRQGSCTTTFSSDGCRIAADAGGIIHVWESVSGVVVFDSLEEHTDHVRCTAFTPDGQQLVTASLDKTIRRWDLQSGTLIGQPLTGHSEDICGGALSRDGKTLVTASDDRTVRFWDIKTWNQKSTFLQHKSRVWRVALSNDGRLLATGGEDGGVYIWDMKAIEAEHEVEVRNEHSQPEVSEGQGNRDNRKSDTTSIQRWFDMLTVDFSFSEAGAKVSYYSTKGWFWEGYDHTSLSDVTGKGKENLDVSDANECKLESHSQPRVFKRLKRLHKSLSFKTLKGGPTSLPPQEAPGVPKISGRASPHGSPMALDPPADVELPQALEDQCRVDTLNPPSTSLLRLRRPMSNLARSRVWKSLWHPSHRDQPSAATTQYRRVAARDLSQPSQVPEQWEPPPWDYLTHMVLPPPPHTPFDDNHDDPPKENPDSERSGAFCGLWSLLFSCRSTAHRKESGAHNSGVEMARLRATLAS